MTSVWVIEQGEYSDYRVVGVFSSQANAQVIAEAIGGDAVVSNWPIDPAVDALHKGLAQFSVNMLADGAVENCERQQVVGSDLIGTMWVWRRSSAPAYAGTGTPDVLRATVWAKDEKHAIKITNEHRARLIVSGEFGQ